MRADVHHAMARQNKNRESPIQKAEIRIATNNNAELMAEALRPEMGITEKTRVEILAEGDELVIRVQAENVVTLRAALNSYLRWTKLAIDMEDAIGAE